MNEKPFFFDNRQNKEHEPGLPDIDLDQLMAAFRRQWRRVALSMFVVTILGGCYALTAVPEYTASTSVLIDSDNSQIMQQLSASGGVIDDEGAVLSQIELMKSIAVATKVVDKLNLPNNVEFMGGGRGRFSETLTIIRSMVNPKRWFGSNTEQLPNSDPDQRKRREAIDRILNNVGVARLGRSYVIVVAYTAKSPQLATVIVSAIAEAYLNDKLDAKYDATRRAGYWLQDRVEELRQRSLESDLAVQKFRAANGLLVANDKLVSDQQLTELNSSLIAAQADTAKSQARLDRIQSIINSGQTDAIVTDALESSVINAMRQKYLDASKRESEISSRLGDQHAQSVRLRQEMDEYRRLMFEELRRIAASYQSELDVAKSREQQLIESVRRATDVNVNASETQVQLRELERTADSYRNLYQTFLQRYQEAVQQQSFPITEARVVSPPMPPEKPSKPRVTFILAISAMLGLLLGLAQAAFSEFRDRFFRVGEQVRDVLGMEYLGAIPLVKRTKQQETSERLSRSALSTNNSIASFAVQHPLSPFAETLRSARIAIDLHVLNKPKKTVGVISALPGEGKSTVAVNLAKSLARSGKTLLIDADLRNPGATRMLAQHADGGLLEVMLDNKPVTSLLLTDNETGLKFLPAVVKRRVPHSSELLTSPKMTELLAQMSTEYEYIVLDLPPLGPVVDARAISGRVDSFLMVIEWGETSRKVVRDVLRSEPQISSRCVGAVLNKVDEKKMKLYRDYGSSEYYSSRYSSYYHENTP
ncbi:polysaccharide biosynthesis tyrosine autokinase [Rhizobium sp.]|uniref:polysaccharide biosynthesis tyrosine autokinase n=1 Tax=Rhizobium sp. TaxID=391 RepID=UPI0028AF25DF